MLQKNLAESKRLVLEEGKTNAAPPPQKEEKPVGAYLAGPDVFLPELIKHFAAKKQITSQAGIEGVAPVDAQMDFGLMQTWALENGNNPRMREAIYEADTGVMQSVRMGIFNLTPFHGATADSGTIFEAGYMVGKDDALGRKPMVFGYSNDPKKLTLRILQWNAHSQGPNYGGGAAQTLYEESVYAPMLDGAILASGGSLRHQLPTIAVESLQQDKRFSDLGAFIPAAMEAAKISKENSLNGGKEGRNRYES